MIRIAVDVMGADAGVAELLRGVCLFHQRRPECKFLIFGTEAALSLELSHCKLPTESFEVVYVEHSIDCNSTVYAALKSRAETSMSKALESVALGAVDGVVSAGNTGVYLALSKRILKTLEGVLRPAIVSQIPTCRGESVMIDLGGNLEVSSKTLVQHAVMAEVFCRKVLGVESPSIGLLNVGTEFQKGSEALREAYEILQCRKDVNFYGYIEGNDIPLGTVDVIVTDGFTGNVALKTGEGTMRMFSIMVNRLFHRSFYAKCIGWLAKPFFKELKTYFDPRLYNGALWLGVRGVAVKSHGGTDALGFSHALETTYDMIRMRIVDEIQGALLIRVYTLDEVHPIKASISSLNV
jgi:glycerol-3-phosphate acyltransferase PlsX